MLPCKRQFINITVNDEGRIYYGEGFWFSKGTRQEIVREYLEAKDKKGSKSLCADAQRLEIGLITRFYTLSIDPMVRGLSGIKGPAFFSGSRGMGIEDFFQDAFRHLKALFHRRKAVIHFICA